MRWKGRKQSTNIEDRRGRKSSFRRKSSFGGIGFFIILLLFLFFGQGKSLLDFSGSAPSPSQSQRPANGKPDEAKEFIGVVLEISEQVWGDIFARSNARYQKPKLVMFSNRVQSACGITSAATGPFYCPGDNKIYIDPNFFSELTRMGGRGDFAKAYVIAHELGHHIQSLQGISDKVTRMQQRTNARQANKLSVRLELQADCYAGIWAHHAEKKLHILDDGDIEEAINAANVIGDDHMQRRAGMGVNTSAFTHGSSKQRVYWLKVGLLTGSVSKCDTFADLR
ncbi:MAG: flagellar biosynthesis protein FlgM [Aquificaceae bacterium]|nr:MAG: flagellar biosynthesis protein FlgM [Aquificaceae bacterium]